MRRTRTIIVVVLLFTTLAIPAILGLGLVEILKPSSTNSPAQPTTSTASVFVDPAEILKDYLDDPGYQVGDKLQVHVNISDGTDLFAWNVNITWNPSTLNFTRIVSYGDFLARTNSPSGTSRSADIVNANNETGYAAIAETILENYPGINGNGRLVTVEFLIVGYGSSDITISINGALPTKLLSSAGNSITFTASGGYFRNKLKGDADGDKVVNMVDWSTISAHWSGPPQGILGYDREVDVYLDGVIGMADIGLVSANWQRTAQ